jgi:ADP-glucose pyrophosphorylase
MLRAQFRGTRCYVALLAAHTGPLNSLCSEPSANIRQSVVGSDVEIGRGVTLDRCVVWPGTTVTRSATKAVITPEHRIEVS